MSDFKKNIIETFFFIKKKIKFFYRSSSSRNLYLLYVALALIPYCHLLTYKISIFILVLLIIVPFYYYLTQDKIEYLQDEKDYSQKSFIEKMLEMFLLQNIISQLKIMKNLLQKRIQFMSEKILFPNNIVFFFSLLMFHFPLLFPISLTLIMIDYLFSKDQFDKWRTDFLKKISQFFSSMNNFFFSFLEIRTLLSLLKNTLFFQKDRSYLPDLSQSYLSLTLRNKISLRRNFFSITTVFIKKKESENNTLGLRVKR